MIGLDFHLLPLEDLNSFLKALLCFCVGHLPNVKLGQIHIRLRVFNRDFPNEFLKDFDCLSRFIIELLPLFEAIECLNGFVEIYCKTVVIFIDVLGWTTLNEQTTLLSM